MQAICRKTRDKKRADDSSRITVAFFITLSPYRIPKSLQFYEHFWLLFIFLWH